MFPNFCVIYPNFSLFFIENYRFISKLLNLNAQMKVTPNQQSWNYESAVARVEAILEQIESGELEIHAVFEKFDAAVKDLSECEKFLAERQRTMDLLIENLTAEVEF